MKANEDMIGTISSSSSSTSNADETANRKWVGYQVYKAKGTNKQGRESSKRPTSSRASDRKHAAADDRTCRSYDPANSIVWDIEKESPVEESKKDGRQGTFAVGYSLPGDKKVTGKAIIETSVPVNQFSTPEDRVVEGPSLGTSDISLGPSQSASRLEGREPPVQAENSGYFSKYFSMPAIRHAPYKATGRNKNKSLLSPVVETLRDARPLIQDLNPPFQSIPLYEAYSSEKTFSDLTFLAEKTPGSHASSVVDILKPAADDATSLDYNEPTRDFLRSASLIGVDAYTVDDLETRSIDYDWNNTFVGPLSIMDDPYLENNCETYDEQSDRRPLCCIYTDSPDETCTETFNLEMGTGTVDAKYDTELPMEQHDYYTDDQSEAAGKRTSPQLTHSGDIFLVDPSYGTFMEDLLYDSPSGSTVQVDEFYQGRMTLKGFGHSLSPQIQGIADVEAEVARHFRQNHWLPQRL